MSWTVHKFGGTSLANADMIRKVAAIVLDHAKTGEVGVVVSAMAGFTDGLHGLVQSAQDKGEEWRDALADLAALQVQTAEELLSGEAFREYVSQVSRDRKIIEDVLHATVLTGSAAPTGKDFVVGHGEIWSASLLRLV
ncbi:MAG: bifunctional aspartate kinase/homoserine dehydrogenase I, partial [Pseudomonadota bacterium]